MGVQVGGRRTQPFVERPANAAFATGVVTPGMLACVVKNHVAARAYLWPVRLNLSGREAVVVAGIDEDDIVSLRTELLEHMGIGRAAIETANDAVELSSLQVVAGTRLRLRIEVDAVQAHVEPSGCLDSRQSAPEDDAGEADQRSQLKDALEVIPGNERVQEVENAAVGIPVEFNVPTHDVECLPRFLRQRHVAGHPSDVWSEVAVGGCRLLEVARHCANVILPTAEGDPGRDIGARVQ
jgi:hypothetical protein